MLLEQYQKAVEELYARIRETQTASIHKAAQCIADSIEKGGEVHLYDSGHLINSEFINRAGGFAFMRRFNYTFNVESNPRKRSCESALKVPEGGALRLAFASSNVRPGDVFILGSVSGKSENIIDMALEAKNAGCTLIAMTSKAYSSTLTTSHPCGKRLFELGDILLDNCAPMGDAMLEVERLSVKAFPASGIAAAYILWSVCADVTEKLLEKNIIPTVYKSINYPDGPSFYKQTSERYDMLGY